KTSSLEIHPHKSNSIRYFLIIIVNSSVRLADLNYGLFFHLRGEGKNKYYGTKVTINVWEPKIQQQYKFTFSQIWLLSDLFRKYLNSIKACWQVHSVNF
ncbi:unnamed protein product, partial [Brassica oleracea]